MTPLNHDARSLIRAARGGDELPAEEQATILEEFARQRLLGDEQPAGVSHVVSLRHRRARHFGWALGGLVLTASLGAAASFTPVFHFLGLVQEAPVPLSQSSTALAEAWRVPAKQHVRNALAPTAQPAAVEALGTPSLTPPSASAVENPEPSLSHESGATFRQQINSPQGSGAKLRPLVARQSLTPSPAARLPSNEPRVAAASPHEVAPSSSLQQELQLIRLARDALTRRDSAEVHRLTEQHANQFPGGQLTEERLAIRALNGCQGTGDTGPAEGFVNAYPSSLFAPRLRQTCNLHTIYVPQDNSSDTHR